MRLTAMDKILTRLLLAFILLAAVSSSWLSSCASSKQKPIDLVWPPPPELPRIRYIGEVKNADSLEETSSPFLDIFLGKKSAERENQLIKPYYAASDGKGRIYVSDTASARVFIFDMNEKNLTFIGEDSVGALLLPLGISIKSDGTVFICDALQRRVNVYTADGKFISTIGKPDILERPTGIAYSEETNTLYVVDTKGHRIAKFSGNGDFLGYIGKRGTAPGEFNFPTGIAVGTDRNIYVVDSMNFRYQVLTSDGKPILQVGKNCNVPGCFSKPKGIGIDSKGHVYVTDAAFSNFQIFNSDGQLLLFVGTPGPSPGQFFLPAGLFIDKNDQIYIVDQWKQNVQIFEYIHQLDEETQATPSPISHPSTRGNP